MGAPGARPMRAAIGVVLLEGCPERVRIEAALSLLMGVKSPRLCCEVMEAGRAIHGHGTLLAEFVPLVQACGGEHV